MNTEYMDRMNLMLDVMTAHKNGKQVECKPRNGGSWKVVQCPCWNWELNEYRVKQEPLEVWVNVYPRGTDVGMGTMHLTRAEADANAGHDRIDCVKFRQVSG